VTYKEGTLPSFYLETKVTPGSDQGEEIVIEVEPLKEGCTGSSFITQNRYVHPHESCGLYIEHSDGSAEKVDVGKDYKISSYLVQV